MNQRGFIFGIYGYLIAGIAIVGVLSFLAWRIYDAGADSVRVEWAQAAEAQRQEEAERAGKASTKLETDNAKARVITRTIERQVDKIVERPVFRNVCLDADGLCLVNAAIRGEEPTSCQSDKPVSPVRAASRWDGEIRLALDYGSSPSLQ